MDSLPYKQMVPKAVQFDVMLIKQNCDEEIDFAVRADVLVDRFIEAIRYFLDQVRRHVKEMDREELLKSKQREKEDFGVLLIIVYNRHRLIEKIGNIGQYCLGVILQPRHFHNDLVYRCLPTVRDKIVKNVPDHHVLGLQVGFYKCGRCVTCKSRGIKLDTLNPNACVDSSM